MLFPHVYSHGSSYNESWAQVIHSLWAFHLPHVLLQHRLPHYATFHSSEHRAGERDALSCLVVERHSAAFADCSTRTLMSKRVYL